MNGHSKLWRRFIILAVLLTALAAPIYTGTSANMCPYPDCDYEPNYCEQQCFNQFDTCINSGSSYFACDKQRYYCLQRCGW
jgi:hypothetical protein